MSNYLRGIAIERQAETWLLSQPGPLKQVIARNYRCRGGEIDLVLEEHDQDGGAELVFVEVRYRAEGAWVRGAESVNWRKQMRLRHAVQRFLQSYRGKAQTVRIDVLARDGEVWEYLRDIRL